MSDWITEEQYWREHFETRPYAEGIAFDVLGVGYRYGHESAQKHQGRQWGDVEPDLERDWEAYEHRGDSTWHQVKDAVKDAWDRATGTRRDTR